jgi:hypothetical protein
MSADLHHHLIGCPVLVTADGERFHRTRIAAVTPSGLYIRLESDESTPNGLERWRARESLQILESYASPSAPSVMHGIVRLKNPAARLRPHTPLPLPPIAGTTASNIVAFPISAIDGTASHSPLIAQISLDR